MCRPSRAERGIRAYGVFTPALLATSLVFIPWPSALMVLGVVLALGPLGIGASASLMEYLEMSSGGELVLLPLVVLASLVDRF